ncbi:MAG: hypothetical protein JRI94_06290 [Deltaproteobacteria bacterium]|nr:hypothetical protein [Deltaproteobacteria bacterium]
MKRRKKPKKKISARHSLTAPEETLLNTLLKDFRDVEPSEIVGRIPDSHFAEILIARLPLTEGPPVSLLLALSERFKEKPVLKALKRAAFKLKKMGIPVGEFYPEKESSGNILKPPQKEKPIAYTGPILDMIGSRAVLILLDRDMKGQNMGAGVVSDEKGIQEFFCGTFSKKRIREIKDSLSLETGPLVETSLSHAATILEKAYHQHIKVHSNAPADYLELRPRLLEDISLLDRPVIHDFLPEVSVSDAILTDSQLKNLFQHKLMESWFIEFDPLRPFLEDILNLDDSPIVLTEAQKLDRSRQIKEKGMEKLFDDEKRGLLKHRFEEMAYFFFKLGEEDSSRVCLVAARIMGEKDSITKMNPVIEFFMERSLDFYFNVMKEAADEEDLKQDSSPGIILP